MSARRLLPVAIVVREYRGAKVDNATLDALFGSCSELAVAFSDAMTRIFALDQPDRAALAAERALQALDTAIDELRHTAR